MARKRRYVMPDPFEEAFREAWCAVRGNGLFGALVNDPTSGWLPYAYLRRHEDSAVARARGWAQVRPDGLIEANPLRRGTPAEWTWVLAHCLLHLGFGHLDAPHAARLDRAYSTACCMAVARFQAALRLGEPPFDLPADLPATAEEKLAAQWRDEGVPDRYADLAVGGAESDRAPAPSRAGTIPRPRTAPPARLPTWADRLSIGLASAAADAIDRAGKLRHERADAPNPDTPWERARRWFASGYPLLAALATGFTVIADRDLARRLEISVAAVNAPAAEIYVNPLTPLSEPEWRFVLAHEMLHAALRHGDRVGGRSPYLWNVAADYVVNGWLVEMGVGEAPDGVLYDPQLQGLSVEAVYDRIGYDLRRLRRLATLRGRGAGDILAGPAHRAGDPTGLDDFYRRALVMGLANHLGQGRGLVPAGLVDEIRVLDQPPLPWDAHLARWFDEHVPARERRRSYARPSRRQSASPDIPRPGWYLPEEVERRATFGVVLDTSGSMDRALLGKALGAIASYAMARDVPAARVVYCDAVAYDAGYVPVEEIAGRVKVRGRGGTVLQHGVRLLETATDFPADGPILVITDGYCDVLRIRREHAFLVPAGHSLPFQPRGPVFSLS